MQIFRNGTLVSPPPGPACIGGDGVVALVPDPCVWSRATEGDGDLVFVVKTSVPSAWTFGAGPLPAVGGIAEVSGLEGTAADESAAPAGGSGLSAGYYAALAAGVAVAVVGVGMAAWYARRRWL